MQLPLPTWQLLSYQLAGNQQRAGLWMRPLQHLMLACGQQQQLAACRLAHWALQPAIPLASTHPSLMLSAASSGGKCVLQHAMGEIR